MYESIRNALLKTNSTQYFTRQFFEIYDRAYRSGDMSLVYRSPFYLKNYKGYVMFVVAYRKALSEKAVA